MAGRLLAATNAHDIDALVACFSGDYVNETPVHPARGFNGQAQVRRNWEQIFASVPDLRAEILSAAVDGADVWTEWDMHGTRGDGSDHHMRGVVVFSVGEGVATRARFYLEPVDATSSTVDDAVRRQVVR
jgi:hypothetical protein